MVGIARQATLRPYWASSPKRASHPRELGSNSETALVNEPESDPRWALIDLILWTIVVLIVIWEVIYLVGHWIFRVW